MESISDILDECWKCPKYGKLEKDHLGKGSEYKFSCSQETVDALEESDPTGRSVEKYITNQKEVDEHEDSAVKLMDEHLRNCKEQGCKKLFEFRVEKGVYKK